MVKLASQDKHYLPRERFLFGNVNYFGIFVDT